MKFCPECDYTLYHKVQGDQLLRICRVCGYTEEDKEGGLVMETVIQQKSTESYKILLNEFTRQDPTLPHTKEIKCPSAACQSNKGAERDVILIKHDAVNLKFIYICNTEGCGETWRSST